MLKKNIAEANDDGRQQMKAGRWLLCQRIAAMVGGWLQWLDDDCIDRLGDIGRGTVSRICHPQDNIPLSMSPRPLV